MATEKERLSKLVAAGVATDSDKTKLRELIEKEDEGPVSTATEPIAEALVAKASGKEKEYTLEGDIDAFKRGGSQFFPPNKDGFHKSALVEVIKPEFTEKDQYWFIFETTDKDKGRGMISAETSKGFFKAKDVLDGIGIPYSIDEDRGQVKFKAALPYPCWADWGRDSKGAGGVKKSSLKPANADIETG